MKQYMLSGARIPAEEAHRLGFISTVVKPDQVGRKGEKRGKKGRGGGGRRGRGDFEGDLTSFFYFETNTLITIII